MSELVDTIILWIVSGSLILGAALMLLAAVGLMRLPDLPTRMHASTKAGTLGAALAMLAVAVFLPEPAVIARAFATIAFLLLTAPVGAHAIGRAAYFVGVPLWEGTRKDELADQYDLDSHCLDSGHFPGRAEKIQALIAGEAVMEPGLAEEAEPIEEGPKSIEDLAIPELEDASKPSIDISDPDLEPQDDVDEPTVESLEDPEPDQAEMMEDEETFAETSEPSESTPSESAPSESDSESESSEDGKKKKKISEEVEA